ncbi:MAG: TIGR03986 family CRISPR-associated RAMP protein [Oscillatoriales cyanobacterium C42_A2020_001]|nr:TIGR03986 family CRISPR-associated RAMP protein [Leptolyngbyaceae cyanobacterium C42_A2020_001]
MFPKHIACVPKSRQALAPYNFVELPDQVVQAQSIPDGDRYHPDRYTGKIECILTTESPIYTRCGWSPEDFAQYGDKAFHELPNEIQQKRANFFINPVTQQPMIPGSSLRGMLRTLVEIASFSKITRVTDNKLFYRSLGDPALKSIYMGNFVEDLGQIQHPPNPKAPCYRAKVHAGFLRKRGSSYAIEECGYGRIDSSFCNSTKQRIFPALSSANVYQGSAQGKTPNWNCQHKTIYVQIDSSEKDYFFPRQVNKSGKQRHPNLYLRFRKVHSASFTQLPDSSPATLVISGDMQHKHLEFAFLHENLKQYLVPEDIIKRFQDDDQVTKWQKDAFPKNQPHQDSRDKDGYLRDGEPVFFLLNDEGNIRFLGRAQMFRLPYSFSPLDFVPVTLRNKSETDLAEAIFGYVEGEKPRDIARIGRVFITDGTLQEGQRNFVEAYQKQEPEQILLSSPKPTTFQHYLVQEEDVAISQLKHYASQPPTETQAGTTVVRGHKLYWHKPKQIESEADKSVSDTQVSLIKPIKSASSFQFTIHFENLSKVELGALLWVLDLAQDEQYRLSLGMGKPLGMGAVKITHKLYLNQRKQRYEKLFADGQWFTGYSAEPDLSKPYIDAFDDHIHQAIGAPKSSLKDVRRIKMLLAMLSWNEAPPSNQTRYLEIERDASQPHIGTPKKGKVNEYADRPVLPTPLQVIGWEDCDDENNNSNSGNSGKGNSPKPNSPKPSKGDRSASKPQKSSSAGTGKTSMAAAFERATQRPKRP